MATVLFLSGCNLMGSKEDNYLEIFKGTGALTMNFLEGMPPDEVYAPSEGKTTPFQVGIEMANKGAQDISSGYFVLSVEKDYMKISKWDTDSEITPIGAAGERVMLNLKGRSQYDPAGSSRLFTVGLEALPIDKQSTQHKSAVAVTSCYGYQTEFSGEICIDADPYNTKPTAKACQAEDLSVSGGQGAPIEITSVEEKIIAQEGSISPEFIITVRNSGTGEVIDKEKTSDACSSSSLGYEYFNIIDIEEVKFSRFSKTNGQIECIPDKIKLKDGEGKARCSLKSGLSNELTTYSTPLYIKLGYGYMASISKEITIKNILAE